MPYRAYISVLGLYRANPDLFQYLTLPTYEKEEDDGNGGTITVTYDYLDTDALIYNLLMECAELEVIYPDADFMMDAIGAWSYMRVHTWEKYAGVLYEDYDPFINIKRHEVRVIEEDRDLASGLTVNVNAWDDSSDDGVLRNKQSGTDTGNVTTTETTDLEGDSAITDAQDVARKEIELRQKYDLYNLIIKEFKQRFCLLVY